MRWADQLIKLSNFELELLQVRLAAVVDRRTRAELKLAVLIAGGEAEIAIALNPSLEGFLSQDKDDYTSLPDAFDRLDGILEREGA